MPNNTLKQLNLIQGLLRSGSLAQARTAILVQCKAKIRRKDRVRLAYLARQAYLSPKAIWLLHRTVRAENGKHATDQEKAEYGMALADLGAGREALEILAKLDIKKLPRILSGLTLAYFREWEWEKALPTIERFLGRSEVSLHDDLWGNYYLGRALMHGYKDWKRSRKIFEYLLAKTRQHDNLGLHQEALLALADNFYLQKAWPQSLQTLDALKSVEESSPDSALALASRQLRAEIRLYTSANKSSALKVLREVKAAYASSGSWLRVRSCDYQEALATRNKELLNHLYYGTPYPGARKNFLTDLGWSMPSQMPPSYDWRISQSTTKEFTLETSSGRSSLGDSCYKAGELPQRALRALSADFYKPATVIELFEKIYPNQYFNPASSPLLVRQALWRLRQWLDENRIPLLIVAEKHAYRLNSEQNVRLRINLPVDAIAGQEGAAGDRLRDFISRARDGFEAEPFTSTQLADSLGISQRSAIDYLKEACSAGMLERTGLGRATRYNLKVE